MKKISEHAQVAKTIRMEPSLNEINQAVIDEDWDLRTSKCGEVFKIEGQMDGYRRIFYEI